MMRINRYLALCGLGSRRKVEQLVLESRVTVNGKPVDSLATLIHEERDRIFVDGKRVRPQERHTYIMLNKPRGVITSASDERGRKTVLDLVRSKARLFPVGRLDAKSEGLLLMTDDGDLAYRLTHPKYEVVKIYRVKLNRSFHQQDFVSLTRGIELEDGPTAPCEAFFYDSDPHRLEIRVSEGRNRLVRRMLEQLDYEVESLKRVQIGPLLLGDLPRGRYRHLKAEEVRLLYQTVGLRKRARQ
ncbi:rRNA pseudouridine synthase [candidate division KSB1 bacterium]|nr:rRNA pseudouridine synthase [candidate division KSB1 bacterium]